MESFVVKKLGGENAAEMFKSARNVINDARNWVQQAVVISAMRWENIKTDSEYSSLKEVMAEMWKKKEKDPKKQRSDIFNTTDVLIEVGKECSKWSSADENMITKYLQAVRDFHSLIIKEKLKEFPEVLLRVNAVMNNALNGFVWILQIFLEQENVMSLPSDENDYIIYDEYWKPHSIMGFWEVLSAKIFSSIINELSEIESPEIQSTVIDTSNAIWEIIWWNAFTTLSTNLSEKVNSESSISIVPWYVGWFKQWIEIAVWRGYSDATAAALAVGMKNSWVDEVTLEIQKSVRGMLSADPRTLENYEDAKLIEFINYIFAKEIIGWAKAKLLHDQALRKEVIESWVKVKIFNPFDPTSHGTIIWENLWKSKKWIQFVWWKEAIFFSVSSITDMWGPWILAKIFEVVKDYASVDIVSSSETEVSFSIEAWTASQLKKIQEKLKKVFNIQRNGKHNFVSYSNGKATIHCVGNLKWIQWLSSEASTLLTQNGINIEISSQWKQERAMIFGIAKKDMKKAVNALHDYFIG